MNIEKSYSYVHEEHSKLLTQLHNRQAIVRDMVRSVSGGYATGLYLYGGPGTGKTHTVTHLLRAESLELFCYQRGHLTPMGLFKLLHDNSDRVVVLDDLTTIFESAVALQILLSALEAPAANDLTRTRVVKYKRNNDEVTTAFRGGVIAISNLELHSKGVLEAFKSRVFTHKYEPSDAQLAAQMLDIARTGKYAIGSPAAEEVAKFVIEETFRLGRRIDLRLFVAKALPAYEQWHNGETESHWQTFVTAGIEEHFSTVRADDAHTDRQSIKQQEYAIIRELEGQFESREAQALAWRGRTGKSKRAFYRRLEEIK